MTLEPVQQPAKQGLQLSCSSHISGGWWCVIITVWICFFKGISCIYEVCRCIVFALHLKVEESSLGERISRSWRENISCQEDWSRTKTGEEISTCDNHSYHTSFWPFWTCWLPSHICRRPLPAWMNPCVTAYTSLEKTQTDYRWVILTDIKCHYTFGTR